MLGIHPHDKYEHTKKEFGLNTVVVFLAILAEELQRAFLVTNCLPSVNEFYGILLGAMVIALSTSGVFTTYNTYKAKKQKVQEG